MANIGLQLILLIYQTTQRNTFKQIEGDKIAQHQFLKTFAIKKAASVNLAIILFDQKNSAPFYSSALALSGLALGIILVVILITC